jgi:hypothetical protein
MRQALLIIDPTQLSDLLFIDLIASQTDLNMDMATLSNWAWLQISFERLRS